MNDFRSTVEGCLRLLREHGLWLTVVVTVGVFLGLFLYSDGAEVFAALERFSWSRFALVLGLTTLGYGFRFAKWEYYLRKVGVRVPLRVSLVTFFSGLMMVVTPGKAGEFWKAWFLRDTEDVPLHRTTSVVGAERITDLIALGVLVALGVLAFSRSSLAVLAILGGLVSSVLLLQWRGFCLRLIGLCEAIPVIGRHASEIETLYDNTYSLLRFEPLTVALALGIIAWGLEGIALWVVLRGLGVEPGLLLATFVFGFGSIVGAVSMLPGGLAATEASMVGVLVSFGHAKSVATVATLLIRIGTLWYAVVLGLVVFVIHSRRG